MARGSAEAWSCARLHPVHRSSHISAGFIACAERDTPPSVHGTIIECSGLAVGSLPLLISSAFPNALSEVPVVQKMTPLALARGRATPPECSTLDELHQQT